MHNEEEDRLGFLLRSHGELQEKYIGKHPSELTGDELVTYLKDMAYATEDEIHEMMNEVDWKPWTPGNDVNVPRAREEMIDELHFFLNRWLALGGTAEMLIRMYISKNAKNHQRLETGYDGRSTKCAECHTDLEELDTRAKLQIICQVIGDTEIRFCTYAHWEQWNDRREQAAETLEGGGVRA